MNFGKAYSAMEMGATMRRVVWAGDMCVLMQRPDAHSFMTEPYLYMRTGIGEGKVKRTPWQPTQVDMIANDWEYA